MSAKPAIEPFSTSPNPVSLFLTETLKGALHKIRYTIDRKRGLTCILGDVGMGKSSVLRLVFSDYSARENYQAVFIPTANFSSDFAFLKAICAELEISPKRSLYDQEKALEQYLLSAYQENRNVAVFIDEAQRLTTKMLEQVRSLLNFETSKSKLIQIVLAGQIELRDRLLADDQKAIRSRIFAPSILDPLTWGETQSMISHRCDLAQIPVPFTEEALQSIYDISGGVPREILKICDMAYEYMRLRKLKEITPEIVESAEKEARLQ